MKLHTVAAALVFGMVLASCNEVEQPKPQPQGRSKFLESLQGQTFQTSPNLPPQGVAGAGELAAPRASALAGLPGGAAGVAPSNRPPAEAVAQAGGRPAPVAAAPAEQVQFPKDARYTLYCMSIAGPDRFPQAARMKAALMANTRFKDWYVVHNERDSTLFYGFYSAVERSPKDGTAAEIAAAAKAHRERDAIIALKDVKGQTPFATAFFTQITPPNPVAPPEWDLANAPAKAFWSVQVAAFMDNPLRKQAAADAVRELREKGVEAYYYHGESISSVCIGTWPKNALKEQEDDSGRNDDPDSPLLVMGDTLPDRYKNAKVFDKDGKKLHPMAERVEIQDQSLQSTLNEYPEHIINYKRRSRQVKLANGQTKDVISPSFLVVIPRPEESIMTNGTAGGFMSGGAGAGAGARQPAETQGLRGLGSTDVWQGKR